MIPCQFYTIAQLFFYIYIGAMLGYALVSWVPSLRGRWSDVLAMLVDPVLQPVRRVLPPIAGFDLSFLVVIIVIQMVVGNFVNPNVCGHRY